jgi:hypothetical protein
MTTAGAAAVRRHGSPKEGADCALGVSSLAPSPGCQILPRKRSIRCHSAAASKGVTSNVEGWAEAG